MAQPAVPLSEDRTELLGIPPFWAKPSINPPFLGESWIGQFFLAVGLKDNINSQDLLSEPVEIEPPPKPETITTGEDAAEANARILRDLVTSFLDFPTNCETLFKVERDYTVERMKLYNTIFMLDNDLFPRLRSAQCSNRIL